jgi:hypothetical protein
LATEGTENTEVFGRLGVLGKLCSKSELLAQRLAFVHKAIKMAFFRSRLKTINFNFIKRSKCREIIDNFVILSFFVA